MNAHNDNAGMVPALQDSLLDHIVDPIIDIGEVFLDSVLEDGILKDIPIIGVIAGMAKAGTKLRERHLAKNTIAFIQGFKSQTVSEDQILEYRERMKDHKIAEKELGYVLIMLDKEIQMKKTKFLGKAYGSFVQGKISWEKFLELSEAISKIFLSDFLLLGKVVNNSPLEVHTDDASYYRFRRLEGLGLLDDSKMDITWETGIQSKHYSLTSFGNLLYGLTYQDQCLLLG